MTTTNMFLNFGGKWDSPPLTKLLSSTCIFTFQNLPSHYVVGIRLFYLAPVRDIVKTLLATSPLLCAN